MFQNKKKNRLYSYCMECQKEKITKDHTDIFIGKTYVYKESSDCVLASIKL